MAVALVRNVVLTENVTEHITKFKESVLKKAFLPVYRQMLLHGSVELTFVVSPNGKVVINIEPPESVKKKNKLDFLLKEIDKGSSVASYVVEKKVKIPLKLKG